MGLRDNMRKLERERKEREKAEAQERRLQLRREEDETMAEATQLLRGWAVGMDTTFRGLHFSDYKPRGRTRTDNSVMDESVHLEFECEGYQFQAEFVRPHVGEPRLRVTLRGTGTAGYLIATPEDLAEAIARRKRIGM